MKRNFGSEYDVIFFPYDWRMSNTASAANKLKAEIEKYNQVVIIAHSMGGLVASSFIQKYPTSADIYIEKVITLGTPYLGAPEFLYIAETGNRFPYGVKSGKLKEYVPNIIGANQLLPFNDISGFSKWTYPIFLRVSLYEK